jgi:hypothetical protein
MLFPLVGERAMTMDLARATARHSAYQWRRPCWVILDRLVGLVVFCGPHEEYLESEPARYFPLEVHYPEGEVENKIS